MSSTWRRYASGLVRDDLAAPDNGVNVNIRATLPRRTHTAGPPSVVDPNLTQWFRTTTWLLLEAGTSIPGHAGYLTCPKTCPASNGRSTGTNF